MQGRDGEWRIVTGVLRRAKEGRGGVVIVDGELGLGKSLLLEQAGVEARRLGITVASGTADVLERLMPLYPLLTAIGESPEALTGQPAEPGVPDTRMWLIGYLQARLEKMASTGPVLVTLDDLQYADPVTLLALRILTQHLASHAVAWVFACSVTRGSDAELLVGQLESAGGIRLRLGPLDEDAIAGYVRNTLGAVPDGPLLALATGTGGNPLLVSELLHGLKEEGALRIEEGQAELVSDHVPQRVQNLMRNRVEELRPLTRQLLEAAAVLGRSFAIEDAARMLGMQPAALLPAVEEALAARFLATSDDMLAFRHELVWRAVIDTIPEPVASALHRQFGEILLDRGGPALPAAEHLLQGARRGDSRILDGLSRAAAEILQSSPQAAADLAMRALELTGPGDPARAERSLTVILALAAAGRLPEAASLTRATLADPLPAVPRARLRCAFSSILAMSGHPEQARTEAEAVLAEPYLEAGLRDQAKIAQLRALAMLPDQREATSQALAILAKPERSGNDVVVAALSVRALVSWDEGRISESLELSREAVQRADGDPSDSRAFQPHLDLAESLVWVRMFDEAASLINAVGGHAATEARPALLRATMNLAAGRLDDAEAEADAAARDLDGEAQARPSAALAECILGTIALRRGDLPSAGHCVRRATELAAEARSWHVEARCRLLAAQVAEAQDGAAAMGEIGGVYDDIARYRWLLIGDPAIAPWLVRTALAAGDTASASRVAASAEALARSNPDFPVLTAPAAHVSGLLHRDALLLRRAADHHTDAWARASAAEDLGVLLVGTGRPDEAIERFDRALGGYEGSGGVRDAARIRQRLRKIGVRRRHWRTADRPVQGWDSLTDTERSIAELVAQGLTNRQIAVQMFVSSHTVAFHLRQIFRKLSIGSRVQLARVTTEQQRPATS